MSTDYAAKEREFLDSLKADTGRDLGEWMEAIRSQGLPHRNDIIDWLRQQGFMFSRASWLERIHNNNGRPIYADQPPTRRPAPRQPRPFPRASAQSAATAGARPVVGPAPMPAPTLPTSPVPASTAPLATVSQPKPELKLVASSSDAKALRPTPTPPMASAVPRPSPAVAPEGLTELLAKAKAYRPLAQYLLREIEKAVPGAVVTVRDGLISIGAPHEFAVVLPSPKDVRLGLDLGDRPAEGSITRTKIAGTSAHISHMMVMTDARQLDAALIELIGAANLNARARVSI